MLDAADPSAIRTLHVRVLARLEQQGADRWGLALFAHHAAAAGAGDLVLRYGLQAAAEAAVAGAHREAAAQLSRAEPYATSLPARERAAFFERLAREQFLTVRPDLGLGAYEHAIRAWRETGDAAEEARVMTDAAKSLVGAGRVRDAEAVARRAATLSDTTAEALVKAEALNVLAYVRLQRRDPGAIDLARRAIEIAHADVRAIETVVTAWNTIGTSRILLGDREGIGDLQRSVELGLEHGLDRSVAHAYANLVESLATTFRFRDVDPNLDAGLRYTSARELDTQRLYLEAWRALTEVPEDDGPRPEIEQRPSSKSRRTRPSAGSWRLSRSEGFEPGVGIATRGFLLTRRSISPIGQPHSSSSGRSGQLVRSLPGWRAIAAGRSRRQNPRYRSPRDAASHGSMTSSCGGGGFRRSSQHGRLWD